MNHLHPHLKRLMHWAGKSPETAVGAAPFGFATRVVNQCLSSVRRTEVPVWEYAVRVGAWASVVVLLVGALFYEHQIRRSKSVYDFTLPYQTVARSIVP